MFIHQMQHRLPFDESSYKLTMADYSQVRDGRYLHSDEDNSLKKPTVQYLPAVSRPKNTPGCYHYDDEQHSIDFLEQFKRQPPARSKSASYMNESISPIEQSSSSTSKDSFSSNNDELTKAVRRQKHRPQHRNTTLNRSLTGIIKPPRNTPRATVSTRSRDRLLSSFDASFSSFSSDLTIRSVEFSTSMEIYFFEK